VARHFTQSRSYRDFNLSAVRTEEEAFLCLTELAFGGRENFACPICSHEGKHYLRKARKQWRCQKCDGYFSPTSQTALHKRKIPCLKLVQAIILFCAGSNGEAASQAAAILGVDPRTSWLLFCKLRECFVLTWDTSPMEGTVQADGGYFGGKPRRPNRRHKHESPAIKSPTRGRKAAIDPTVNKWQMEPWNVEKLKKRRCVLAIRQLAEKRGQGSNRTVIAIVHGESYAAIQSVFAEAVKPGSRVMTDSGTGYMPLILNYELQTVNHSKEYSTMDGVNNNQAESYLARLRRGEYGVFRAMRPTYLLDYCIEMAWREDWRRRSIGEKVREIFKRVRQCGPSPSFCGYYQGHRRQTEWTRCPAPGSASRG
jgi:transposase-like protein